MGSNISNDELDDHDSPNVINLGNGVQLVRCRLDEASLKLLLKNPFCAVEPIRVKLVDARTGQMFVFPNKFLKNVAIAEQLTAAIETMKETIQEQKEESTPIEQLNFNENKTINKVDIEPDREKLPKSTPETDDRGFLVAKPQEEMSVGDCNKTVVQQTEVFVKEYLAEQAERQRKNKEKDDQEFENFNKVLAELRTSGERTHANDFRREQELSTQRRSEVRAKRERASQVFNSAFREQQAEFKQASENYQRSRNEQNARNLQFQNEMAALEASFHENRFGN